MTDLIPTPELPRIPVRGGGAFPVRRIYCVGRNYADHAREMGATPAAAADRGRPMFFAKPADAIVPGNDDALPYPLATANLHHEVELVVAIGKDAPAGVLPVEQAMDLVLAYGVGLDLTRRDLQAAAKAAGAPWDIAKGFDRSAPVSELVLASDVGDLGNRAITLDVNGERRQSGHLDQMIWNVADILHELSRLFDLKAGDLVMMGTPAGVGPLVRGDQYVAHIDGIGTRAGRIV